jgi:hypothetical protein
MGKRILFFASIFLCFIGIPIGYSQVTSVNKGLNAISNQSSQAILTYLASDWMEGREPGTKGHDNAADYLASMYQMYGLRPIIKLKDPYSAVDNMYFPNNAFFQNFPLIMLNESTNHKLSIVTRNGGSTIEERFDYKTDFVTSDFVGVPTRSLVGDFPIVFVGYGIVDEKTGYDDFKGIDVKGKIVLRLRGYPGHNDTSSLAFKTFNVVRKNAFSYMNFEYDKNKIALQKGAIGCLEVNMENEALTYQGTNIFRYNRGRYESDEPVKDKASLRMVFMLEDTLKKSLVGYSISHRFANELTDGTNVNLTDFENSVKKTLKPASGEIKNKLIKLGSKSDWDLISCRNIIGMIEGEDPDQIVVVGAHYDHLGKFSGDIYNGSDDNASGTVAVLEIAKACLATGVKPKRTIVFAAWDAEEMGLYGSNYFLKHPVSKGIFANINFDMISRNPSNDSKGTYCKVVYTKPYGILKTNTERFIKENNLKLVADFNSDEIPSYGTDSDSFAEEGIPIIFFESGMHTDYHKPSDESSRANLIKMTEIIRLGFLTVWELANTETLK